MEALPIRAERRLLGRSALASFPLAYGCWRLADTDRRRAREIVETALETGINLFDHADIYGGSGAAEELFGKVLAEAPQLRSRMLIATKGGIQRPIPYDSSPGHIASAAEASLRRLGTDVIDLYQIHRPDILAHPEEVASALTRLRAAGKIREAGVSNYSPSQFEALQAFVPFPLATHQPELNALAIAPLRDGLLDQCMRARVTPLAWSPLARGRLGLSIEAARREPDGQRLAAVIERLEALARREEAPAAAVALAFLLVHPAGIVPIIGTRRPERIRDCAAALRVRLSRTDWYAILEASQGTPHP
jgi:predicted oxidoreductase